MLFVLALIACGADTADTAAADAAPSVLPELSAFLTGEFSSYEQSVSNPSYYDIRLVGCEIDAPELGDNVLYIEQASSDSLSTPYRQRLYVLEDIGADAEGNLMGRSVIYSLDNESDYIGGCDDGGGWSISADEVTIRNGCEVELTWFDDHFTGSTIEDNCESDLYGASYATSEVALYEDRIESWDQGWYEDDTYAWGAVDGAYIFNRVE